MNAKMLITPLLIVVVIALLIWLVYPAYSNGIDGVKEKYNQLGAEKTKYEGLKNRIQNAEKLFLEISSLGEDRDMLYRFIPEEIKEEEIIDNLNYLASLTGVSISQISILQSKVNSAVVLSPAAGAESEMPDEIGESNISSSRPVDIGISLNLFGNYENIKNFFDKVDKLERFAEFSKLEISKVQASEANETSLNVLSVKADINFNYLDKMKLSKINSFDPVFSSDKMDLNAIAEIKNKKTTEILNLEVGQKGKINPFMP